VRAVVGAIPSASAAALGPFPLTMCDASVASVRAKPKYARNCSLERRAAASGSIAITMTSACCVESSSDADNGVTRTVSAPAPFDAASFKRPAPSVLLRHAAALTSW
jgi:hypothetical protein